MPPRAEDKSGGAGGGWNGLPGEAGPRPPDVWVGTGGWWGGEYFWHKEGRGASVVGA